MGVCSALTSMRPQASNPAIPLLTATAGMGTFAAMDAFMKALSIEMGAYNAILWRSCIGLGIAAVLFFAMRSRWPVRSTLRIHVWRGLVVSLMAFLFFWGLAYVPLAEAIALSFIAPLITLYLAAVLLFEEIGRRAIIASVLGFGGAIVIVTGQLSGNLDSKMVPGIAAILLSAVLYAYNLILQRQQALVADPIEIALFQNATMLGAYAALAPWFAVVPTPTQLPWLAAAAVLSLTSVLLISWAYARAQAKTLIPVEYTAFVWAALLGWLVFDEVVTLVTVIGTGFIVLGCLLAMRESRAPGARQPEAVSS